MQSSGSGGHCTADSGKFHLQKSYLDAIGSLGLCAKGISDTVPSAERHLCACCRLAEWDRGSNACMQSVSYRGQFHASLISCPVEFLNTGQRALRLCSLHNLKGSVTVIQAEPLDGQLRYLCE